MLLAGCSGDSAASAGPAAARRRRATATGRESAALLERYDATLAAHPALASRLGPLRAEVVRHAEAFGAGAAASPSASAPAPTARQNVPGEEKAALAALAEAERRTADARSAALVTAPAELARLLASVAAAGAAHAYLLGGAP
ncbi:hypothetical protein ACFQ2B_09055 [Streptomyces stramineus]